MRTLGKNLIRLALLGAIAAPGALSTAQAHRAASPVTITVVYQDQPPPPYWDEQIWKRVKQQVEASNPNIKVNLQPVIAQEGPYYTKIDLMLRSPSTAPDIVREDSFLISSDATAGYLLSLNKYLATWPEYKQQWFPGMQAITTFHGNNYGIMNGTDDRLIWYNKDLFKQAGLPTTWQPHSWADILSAARTIKAKLPGVVPMNIYSGIPADEASSMQGFEMLLYGTHDTLYDSSSKKWIAPSKGFTDALQFLKDAYGGGLTIPPQQELDPNIPNVVAGQMIPAGKLAIDLDGSWVTGTWGTSGAKPWPDWNSAIGEAAMPTQDGSGKGTISLSGGWTLAVTAKSKNKDLAAQFIELALNKDNSASYDIADSQIAVRDDVAADAKYQSTNPTTAFFTGLVPVTQYRPAYAEYPKVSDAIQVAMEAVITGQSSPADAMKAYTETLKGIVGSDNVAPGAS